MDEKIAKIIESERARQAEEKRVQQEHTRKIEEERKLAWAAENELIRAALPGYARIYAEQLYSKSHDPEHRYVMDVAIQIDRFARIEVPIAWSDEQKKYSIDTDRWIRVDRAYISRYMEPRVAWDAENPVLVESIPEALVIADEQGKAFEQMVAQLKQELDERLAVAEKREVEYVPPAEQNDLTAALVNLVRDVVREVMQEMAAD